LNEEQRSLRGRIAGRMQLAFHHGLLGRLAIVDRRSTDGMTIDGRPNAIESAIDDPSRRAVNRQSTI